MVVKVVARKLARALDSFGREKLDQTPVSVPAGFKRPESLEEQIKRLIQTREFGRLVTGDDQAETFEEADDFDIPDDPADPASPHEEFFDPTLERSVTAHEAVHQADRLNAETESRVSRRRTVASSPPASGTPEPGQEPTAGQGPGKPE